MDKNKPEIVLKKDGEGKVRLVSVKFDAVPVPIFEEPKSSDWVYAGKYNGYFDFLLDLYNTANMHSSIINNKIMYVVGNGWSVVDKTTTKVEEGMDDISDIQANGDGDSFDDVLQKVASDYEIFDGYCIEVTYDATFNNVAEIRQVDFSKVRVNKDETEYAYADHWLNVKGKPLTKAKIEDPDNGWTVYKPFNPETAKEDGGVQLLYFKKYRPSVDYYPLPEYVAGTQYIVAEKKIGEYHVNNIDNNFWNNFIVHFRDGEPTEQEKRELVNQFKERHNGASANEKVLFTFSDPGIDPPSVDEIGANNSADVFEYLSSEVESQIFIGHQVTSPMLFGVKTEGQLGGRTEIIDANELYQNRYVKPRQKQLEVSFNMIMSVNNTDDVLKIKPMQPVTYDVFTSQAMLESLTLNEKRRILKERYNIELDADANLDEILNRDIGMVDPTPPSPPDPKLRGFSQLSTEEPRWMTEEEEAEMLKNLEGKGEIIDTSQYNLLTSDDLGEYNSEAQFFGKGDIWVEDMEFAEVIDANPNKRSWRQDSPPFIKIRYRYAGRLQHNSRDFCVKMINANKLYRLEDILNAGPVNPGFGKGGSDEYNIFKYKGGPNCKHWWKREIYVLGGKTPVPARKIRSILRGNFPDIKLATTPLGDIVIKPNNIRVKVGENKRGGPIYRKLGGRTGLLGLKTIKVKGPFGTSISFDPTKAIVPEMNKVAKTKPEDMRNNGYASRRSKNRNQRRR